MEPEIWTPYEGASTVILAIGFTAAAAVLVVLGLRLRRPWSTARTAGPLTGVFLGFALPLTAVSMTLVRIAYGMALLAQHTDPVTPANNPITKFTWTFAVIAGGAIVLMTWNYGWRTAIISGIAGAGAGPVMFEFPFIWPVVFRLSTPEPVALYRWMFLVPLFIFIVLTLCLLTLTPAARLNRATLFALAGMFVLWALWALTGFAYPNTAVSLFFNVVSKFVAAVAGVMIFLPDRRPSGQPAVHAG